MIKAVEMEDIIDILQRYKPSAQKIFRNKVNLEFSRQKKEIMFEIPCSGNYYSKKIVYEQMNYRVLELEELLVPATILKLVDGWIEILTCVQAEAVFWRYINHDFEVSLDERDWRIRYKTLSYEKIGEKMDRDVRAVWEALRRGMRKILDCVNEREEVVKLIAVLVLTLNENHV